MATATTGKDSANKAACGPAQTTGDELFDEHATLCEIEKIMREYVFGYYEPHAAALDRPFAPGTVRMAEAVKPLLEHLAHGRAVAAAQRE